MHRVRAVVSLLPVRAVRSSCARWREGRGVRRERSRVVAGRRARLTSPCVDAAVLLERPATDAIWTATSRAFPVCGATPMGSRSTSSAARSFYGRSESTLNRGGVRMGTSEFYRVVDTLPEIQDSLVVIPDPRSRGGQARLFFVLARAQLDRRSRRSCAIRCEVRSRRATCRTNSAPCRKSADFEWKKVEVPIKRILSGARPTSAATPTRSPSTRARRLLRARQR